MGGMKIKRNIVDTLSQDMDPREVKCRVISAATKRVLLGFWGLAVWIHL
jgi:hypothetical protein